MTVMNTVVQTKLVPLALSLKFITYYWLLACREDALRVVLSLYVTNIHIACHDVKEL